MKTRQFLSNVLMENVQPVLVQILGLLNEGSKLQYYSEMIFLEKARSVKMPLVTISVFFCASQQQ